MDDRELVEILIELITRQVLAIESIADAIASHVEVFDASNDET